MSKAELRAGWIFGCMFALFPLVFYVLPVLISGAGTISMTGILGDRVLTLGPGFQMAHLLLLLPLFVAGLFGTFFGIQFRRTRQLQLLGAANPEAPVHLRNRYSLRFWDRIVYRLSSDGTDTQGTSN